MIDKSRFEAALQLIKNHEVIIIHRHLNPDGDALGSQIGLKRIIKAGFPEKAVYAVGDPAGRYSFMEDSLMDTVPDSAYEKALAVILDTSSESLISDERYASAHSTLRLDHHIFTHSIAQTEIIDTSYESCCSIIADFARTCGLKLDSIAAESLFTGLVTDSGRFRYDSTSARTFELASYLMQCGFDIAEVYSNLYSEDIESVRMRAGFMLRIKTTPNNVAYIYSTADELSRLGISAFTAARGMVGTMADIKGITIWASFAESDKGIICEIRSSTHNINPIAGKYGGGGHAKASGATVESRAIAMQLLDDLDRMAAETGEQNE